MNIDDKFIDDFNNIYTSELKDMKSKLIENGIKFDDDRDVIYIFKDIKNMNRNQIEKWKNCNLNEDYDNIDNVEIDENYQAGLILMNSDINPKKIKIFINKISFYGRVFLAYKLSLI